MKHSTPFLLTLIFMVLGLQSQAQWYFETGINDAKFTQYNAENPTTIHSYNGLRDVSFGLGYLFPASLEKRSADDAKRRALHVGFGVGFDQMSLKTVAADGGGRLPSHYDFGQLHARLFAQYTPTLIKKKEADASGMRQPILNFLLEAGVSYHHYTSAVRTTFGNGGGIQDLHSSAQFESNFPGYAFGAGFEFPLNRYSAIYTKYVVENAFSNDEKDPNSQAELFSTFKSRALVGVRIDFKLKKALEAKQRQRIADLEAEVAAMQEVDLTPLERKIKAVEDDLSDRIDKLLPQIHDHIYDTKKHEKGFSYIPDFKHVLFDLDSSHFDDDGYHSDLKRLVQFLAKNDNVRLKLVGYADSKTGSEPYNQQLSAKRAKRVYDYLVSLGADPNRMEHVSAGGTLQFSVDELTENRRTEIIIIE